jgi:hypothetical protein
MNVKIDLFSPCNNELCYDGYLWDDDKCESTEEKCPECGGAGKLPSKPGVEILELIRLFGGQDANAWS